MLFVVAIINNNIIIVDQSCLKWIIIIKNGDNYYFVINVEFSTTRSLSGLVGFWVVV